MPTYHHRLRGKRSLSSVLDEIPGIGPKRKKTLIKAFGALDRLKEASIEEIAALPLATRIVEQLHRVNDEGSL